jgi:hypothetical protein
VYSDDERRNHEVPERTSGLPLATLEDGWPRVRGM